MIAGRRDIWRGRRACQEKAMRVVRKEQEEFVREKVGAKMWTADPNPKACRRTRHMS